MHLFLPAIDSFWTLLLALPAGFGLAARRRKGGGDEEESVTAYQLLIESNFDGVLSMDAEGIITWADNRFLKLMGGGRNQIEGQPFASLMEPGDAERVQQYLSQSLQQPQKFQALAIDNGGSVLNLEISTVMWSDNGEVEIFAGVKDISEEDALRKRLEFTEKMNLLSRVMNSIGADLERTLQIMGPMADTVDDPKIRETLDRITDLSRRIELFPRRGIKGGTDIEVANLVRSAIAEVSDELSVSSGQIVQEIAKTMYPVFGDPEQLAEAIRNVIRNACQAAELTHGEVRISCYPMTVDRALPRSGFILPPGEYVRLDITDTGPGMPHVILDHAFEPLFSTRPGSPLSGLGLAVTYTVVKNHRGYIDIESTQGEGTSIEIFIPRSRIRERIEHEPPAEVASVETAPPEEIAVEEAIEAEEAPVELLSAAELTAEEPHVEPPEVEEVEVLVEDEPAEEIAAEDVPLTAETAIAEEPETVEPAEVSAGVEEAVEPPVEEPVELPVAEVVDAPSEPAAEEVVIPTDVTGEDAEAPPVEEEVVEEEILDEAEIASLSGHETVLIIEEDEAVRSMVQETLTHFGYNALPARNWVEGVDLFKKHSYLVDLVLLNVLVPEMVWVKTLMDLRKAAPQARIGLMGDYERTDTMERYLQMPGIDFLIKPLTTAILMRGVRTLIDTPMEAGAATEE